MASIDKDKNKVKIDESSRNVEVLVRTMKQDYQYSYNLFDEFGNLILEAHVPISESLLNHLRNSNIERLYYDPTKAQETDGENVAGLNTGKSIVDEALAMETVQNVKDFMDHIRDIYNFSPGASVSKVRIEESRAQVDKLMASVEKNSDGVFNPITKLKELDDYTYVHSANVSILSAILGSRLEFKKEIRLAMGLGGLFHDMGKAPISKDIVNKASLNDEEFDLIKYHPHVGYKLIETNPHMHDIEKRIILLHHERTDGEGFPFGFDLDQYENQTPREIRLFALCNEYILMVQNKPGVKPLSSRDALRKMLNLVFAPYKKVHSFLIRDFKEFVKALGYIVNNGSYFIVKGDLVRMNTGEIGIIEEMNKLFPLNPKVKILKNHKLETLKRPIIIDMLKDYNNFISNVYDKTGPVKAGE